VPLHPPPDHPLKDDPVVSAALNMTTVPWSKLLLHEAPQSMPAGSLVTVPVPLPDLVTVKAYVCALSSEPSVSPVPHAVKMNVSNPIKKMANGLDTA
jgi:hypothetical protein